MKRKKNKIAVIGGGIGGISLAINLLSEGFQVDLYEKNNTLGGKISEIHSNGFRFDTGPSLFTLPNLVTNLLNKNRTNIPFNYTKLDTTCRYFYPDNTTLDASADTEKFADELAHKHGENKAKILRHFAKLRELYNLTAPVFIFESFQQIKNYFTSKFIRAALQIHKLDSLVSMHQRNKKRFSNPKTVQLFDRYATYNGSNPYKTPATFNVIAHLEHNEGAFFPEKGMFDIVKTLSQQLQILGANIFLNKEVNQIILEDNKVKAIDVEGKLLEYDAVVTDLDVHFVYTKLLKKRPPSFFQAKSCSTSALIFYWEMSKQFEQLDLHNIFFSADYKAEFEHLFKHKTIFQDPTVYVFISNKITKKDAPTGKENWFVMINVPENTNQNWQQMIDTARKNIQNKLNKILHTNIASYIEKEHLNTPQSIEKKTASYRGSLYGNSSNHTFSAFMRHPNFRNKIKNLYFVGGSVHPGGGIPLSIASANIVSKIITQKRSL